MNSTIKKAYRLINAAQRLAKTREGKDRIEEIRVYENYAEPGYGPGPVAIGNWNNCDRYDSETHTRVETDAMPERLSEALEKLGVEIEWSDQWAECLECCGLVRTDPDSYFWKPSYALINDCEIVCLECLDPESHLESLEGDDSSANTIETIDPAEHGYTLAQNGFESGWHPGQDASPEKIGAALRARGITRYVFQITEPSQFYTRYAVYVHDDEIERLAEPLTDTETQGDSNSARLERMLRSIPKE